MKKIFFSIVIFVFTSILIQAQETIKIACIGNSITFGSGVENRTKKSYPAQLQSMLGNSYEVTNFGVGGRTLLKNGNLPYWNTKEYKNALASNPDIVFIMLGTNDSKSINRPFYNEFERDYKNLIQSFKSLPSNPRIILLLPIPSFVTDSNYIYDPIIQNEITPRIQKVAFETESELINLYPLFINKERFLPDKVHPSALGATIIARRLYEVVKLNEKKDFDIFENIKTDKKISSFYGFECASFTLNGRACKIVKPKKPIDGLAWVWRARFWGHEPQTDIALLERGYHIVYCDVAELYGNKKAIKIWNNYYDYLQTLGLSKKAVLEGMSRGGIYIYNWTLANPNKVACIYADAPVLDFKSWPGGKGQSAGSIENWEIFKKDYNLSERKALKFRKSPLDKASKIARLKIPIIHVVGDADDVVPVAENTTPFEQKLKSKGAEITVIHKPNVNHHPHSLANPTPIVDFILRATNNRVNLASIAAPGSEYRSGAGWKNNKDWWGQNENIDSLLLTEKNLDILFLGNSITQGIMGNRTYISHDPGFEPFKNAFKNYSWECAGISGDRTQNVLWRLENGNYKTAKPKIIVLTIGVNNFPDDSAEEVVEGIDRIIQWIKINIPDTKILLVGPLPAGIEKDHIYRKKYEQVHSILKKQLSKDVIYAAIANVMFESDGKVNLNYYSNDGIHLKPAGYKIWADDLKKHVDLYFEKNNKKKSKTL